ncbi:MAG: 30S ribosomal protein S20 [Candidatus Cloacimonadales bacterium]|jgi:small subunit ribosomal protein S20|nr:30S ribosomal protein S20 [Candidatus Cloacimonadota bacterium]MCK9292321.1 30S ribosomal protein S20 [Bacteroidales bacterium]MDD2650921.1 30S ribosomal protein S20 [Candidatus Cloacimonadota bacterium]MDD3502320.1 30S ribosomal protein S20 [Candidatus Cloacimonadota bacterium]MDX9978163.1 30S ribosomal protein S20 [Candidatus Cloacimonadales bacterium]
MPNHKSPAKSLKQDAKRFARNNYVRSTLKTLSKKMHSDISIEEKREILEKVYSQLDKAAKKGVIHPRTASRRKSRIALHFNKEVSASQSTEE